MVLAALIGAVVWFFATGSSPPPAWDHQKIAALTADLHDADGKPAPPSTLTGAKHVLVYFSASWCGPCRAFTPELVAYYKSHGGGSAFQLLFVSSDQTADAMYAYMHDDAMPWWGVRFQSESAKALAKAYRGPGIPCLVLLDQHGWVQADSFVNGRYVGPHEVLKALEAAR
jgi:nucleoredoxin